MEESAPVTNRSDGPVARRALAAILGAGVIGSTLVLTGALGTGRPTIEVSSGQDPDAPIEHDHTDHDHPSILGPDGRFTGPGDVWPPEPRNATDIVELEFPPEPGGTVAADGVFAQALTVEAGPAETALGDAALAAALGERYNLISVVDDETVPGTTKDEADTATLVSFFSLSNGVTVEAFVAGGAVVEAVVSPASDHQPPLSDSEKDRAVEIARAHWEQEGDERIDVLEGFTILAVEPSGAYYDSRMTYVSFHVDNTSDPELLTWVDLTTETVHDARVDR